MSRRITAPLSLAALREMADEQNFVTVEVVMDLDELIGVEFEDFLDSLATQVTGSPVGLMQHEYTAVGAENGNVILQVAGEVNFADMEEDDLNDDLGGDR